ncbi:MAG: glycosyltransferase family 2 protein, partial [Paracoccaceae bacterium]
MGETATGPQFLYRQLAADADTLDCLVRPARRGREVRWFGREGAKLGPPDPTLPLKQMERREVAGALLLVARLPARGTLTLTFADGPRAVTMAAPDTDFLKGRNCLLAFRSVESIATILDWLAYHARTQDATGAVIVNRAQPDPAFADELASALSSSPKTVDLDLHVVLLDSPVPLGKAGEFPEDHPIMAPDAPGKDRMESPAPDPFRAPVSESLIYEVAKWRFLTEARAVVTLDCSDLLAPPDGPSAFDRCVSAQGGVILLVGRRIYPWRIRRNLPEAFGDHICRQFDARRGLARWGVVPARAGIERTWRSTRVAFARPDPTQTVPFWRAMGLRIPGRKPGELAPKTSLIEDPELLTLMRDQFGAKPVRPPLSTT